jgi:hypothetical protein
MSHAVRVTDDYVGLMGRFVVEGQAIVPGLPLMDIMTPEGIVQTIRSECWGIIAHIEGHRVFSNNNDAELVDEDYDPHENGDDEDEDEDGEAGSGRSSSGGASVVFAKGDLICHIISRGDQGSIRGGRPHPSTSRSISNAKAEGRLLPTYG